MADYTIGNQYGRDFYQAETIHVHAAKEHDHAATAEGALARKDYRTACRSFTEALGSGANSPRLHYGLALALLAGTRPVLHRASDIGTVRDRLTLSGLPEAKILSLLVEEDHRSLWRSPNPLPAEVRDFVAALDPDAANEIILHLHVPESRVWRLLSARAGGRTP